MASFCESIIQEASGLIDQIRSHPFIVQTASNTIPGTVFRRFATQNYLRLREFERFLAALSSRAPEAVRDQLSAAMLKNHNDIELYEELAAKLDVNLAKAQMTYDCHAYVCFLHAVANMRSFEEAICALYGTEYALHAGWTPVKTSQTQKSPWQEFIDLWGGEGIAEWVRSLGSIIDTLAPQATQECRAQMAESFRTALQYRLRFWSMSFQSTDW